MAATSLSLSPTDASIFLRSSLATSPSSRRPSTNNRRPRCVGMRPAETWGLSSNPRYSRSCMTLRIVAAESFSVMVRDRVRDPIGSPELRYPSTTLRNTSRDRSFISASRFEASTIHDSPGPSMYGRGAAASIGLACGGPARISDTSQTKGGSCVPQVGN